MRLLDFIEKCIGADEEAAFGLLTDFAAQHDLPHLVHTFVGPKLAPITRLKAPTDWTETYFSQALYRQDPVVLHALHLKRPFTWDEPSFKRLLSSGQARFMAMAEAHGIASGASIPVPSLGRGLGLASFSSVDRRPFEPGVMRDLQIATTHYQLRREPFSIPEKPSLRPREIECLHWAAAGKSYWETAQIIGISEVTVREYVRHAMRKLGVGNKIAAVAKAVQSGIVVP